MATKDQFSASEWDDVMGAPALAGALVIAAAPSGPVGMVQEVLAISSGMRDLAVNGSGSLLAIIASELAFEGEREGEGEARAKQRYAGTVEQTRQQMLDGVKRVCAMVEQKLGAEEAKHYREYCAGVAQRVAEAAKEGGFLGIGGETVSAKENTVLSELRSAIGV